MEKGLPEKPDASLQQQSGNVLFLRSLDVSVVVDVQYPNLLQSTTAGSDSEEEKVMETYVVQRYIDKPYLVGGKKYDMRLYLLCLSYNPLTLYIYRRGFARFSSTHYQVRDSFNT